MMETTDPCVGPMRDRRVHKSPEPRVGDDKGDGLSGEEELE